MGGNTNRRINIISREYQWEINKKEKQKEGETVLTVAVKIVH
jgi:hypothetical protein